MMVNKYRFFSYFYRFLVAIILIPGQVVPQSPPPGTASSEVLIYYPFTGDSPEPAGTVSGLQGTNFSISSGSVLFRSANAGDWTGSGVPYAQGNQSWNAAQLSEAKYFSFVLEVDEAQSFSLDGIRFLYRATASGPSAVTVSVNDVPVATVDVTADQTLLFESGLYFEDLDMAEIRIAGWDNGSRVTTGGGQFRLDDVELTGTVDFGDSPFVVANPSEITTLSGTKGETATVPESFLVSGGNLDGVEMAIEVAGPFEISEYPDADYSASLIFFPYDGSEMELWIRLQPGLPEGEYSGFITITAGSAEEQVLLHGRMEEDVFILFDFRDSSSEPSRRPGFAHVSELNISSGSLQFSTAGQWPGSGVPVVQGNSGWSAMDPMDAKYFYFNVVPDHGYAVTLDRFSMYMQATAAGPSAVTIEINGRDVATLEVSSGSIEHIDLDLEGFVELEDAVVKIKGWDNGSRTTTGGGAFRLNDIRLDGELAESTFFLKLTGNPGYRMFSIPLQDVSFGDFLEPFWTQGLDNAPRDGGNRTGGDPNVFRWDRDAPDNSVAYWEAVRNLSKVPDAGSGFLVYIFEGEQQGNGTNDTDPLPKRVIITGNPHQTQDGVIHAQLNPNPSGWSLPGNPFTRPVNFFDIFQHQNTDRVHDAIYIWDANSDAVPSENPGNGQDTGAGRWKSYTAATGAGDIANGWIAPFQGFFIQNTEEGNGTLVFPETALGEEAAFFGKNTMGHTADLADAARHKTAPWDQKMQKEGLRYQKGQKMDMRDVPGRIEAPPHGIRQHAVPPDAIRIEFQMGGKTDALWLRFSEDGSMAKTAGDAYQLTPLSEEYVLISAQKERDLFDIAHLPLPGETFGLPLMLDATAEGEGIIRVTEHTAGSLPALILEDPATQQFTEIRKGMEYRFQLDHQGSMAGQPLEKKSLAVIEKPKQFQETKPVGARKNLEGLKRTGQYDWKEKKNRLGEMEMGSLSRFTLAGSAGTETRFVIRTGTDLLKDSEDLEKAGPVMLRQNYPNPFNHSTSIIYEIPAATHVRMTVYDIMGRRVSTIVDEYQREGVHRVAWNAEGFSSGVYVYRIAANGYTTTRNMILVK